MAGGGTTVLTVLAFVAGALIVVATLLSAIMTVVVPRALPMMITRGVFSGIPSMYQSFQRREAAVTALDVRADTPPTARAMLVRSSIIGGWDRLEQLWRDWEAWFVDITETHTSLSALVFFRFRTGSTRG